MRLTGWRSAASCHCVMCWDAAWPPSLRSVQWAANGLSSTARDGRRPCRRRPRSSLLIYFGWILPVWFVCDTEFVFVLLFIAWARASWSQLSSRRRQPILYCQLCNNTVLLYFFFSFFVCDLLPTFWFLRVLLVASFKLPAGSLLSSFTDALEDFSRTCFLAAGIYAFRVWWENALRVSPISSIKGSTASAGLLPLYTQCSSCTFVWFIPGSALFLCVLVEQKENKSCVYREFIFAFLDQMVKKNNHFFREGVQVLVFQYSLILST